MLNLFENIKIIKGNIVAGVQLDFISDDDVQIDCTLLKENKSEVEIIKHESFNSVEKLIDFLGDSIPIFISIDGKGVLHRKVEKGESQEVDSSLLLNQTFPSIRVDNFYIQESTIEHDSVFFSLVRKNKIDELLKQFNDKKHYLLGIMLGPFNIKSIQELLNHSDSFVWTRGYKIGFNNNEITDLIKVDKIPGGIEYNVGSEHIPMDYLLSFATGFLYFVKDINYKTDLSGIVVKQKEEFLFKKLFKLFAWSMLILLFTILLGNYILFDHYNSKNNELNMNYSQNKNFIVKLDKLKEELKTKESFLKENSILKISRLSFYADRIALHIPNEIILSKLVIQPLDKKIQEDEEISFEKSVIRINGTTDNSQNFNFWIKKLKKEQWIGEINIVHYSQYNKQEAGDFEIEIIIKNN